MPTTTSAPNKITFGLKNCYYSKATEASDGTFTFATPVALPGAQEFSTDIVGGVTNVNADDQIIKTVNSLTGRTLTLKLTELPVSFKKDILGYKEITTSGNLVEVANAPTVTFALGLEIQGDSTARRTWFYLCTVTPIGEASKTKSDSIEVNAITLNITARPISAGAVSILKISANPDNSNYATFLTTAPTVPVIS